MGNNVVDDDFGEEMMRMILRQMIIIESYNNLNFLTSTYPGNSRGASIRVKKRRLDCIRQL